MKKVLIVDDHPLIFDGLQSHLNNRLELYYAPDLSTARTLLHDNSIDEVILDLRIGLEDGFDFLQEYGTLISIYVLTMHRSPWLVDRSRKLHAKGYFLKDESLAPLIETLDSDKETDFIYPASMVEPSSKENQVAENFKKLTEREQQVFVLVAEGLNYKEIAHRLHLSPKTINVHRENLMGKLNIDSLADLVKMAIHLGLVKFR